MSRQTQSLLQEQDQQLSVLGQGVKRVKALAGDMRTELQASGSLARRPPRGSGFPRDLCTRWWWQDTPHLAAPALVLTPPPPAFTGADGDPREPGGRHRQRGLVDEVDAQPHERALRADRLLRASPVEHHPVFAW